MRSRPGCRRRGRRRSSSPGRRCSTRSRPRARRSPPASDRMTAEVPPLRQRPAWGELERHHGEVRERHLRELFAADEERGTRLTAEGAGLYLDYSKNRVVDETISLLLRLAA